MAVCDITILNHITKKLYPEIAFKYGATPSRVERTIQHAISIAWQKEEQGASKDSIFGYMNSSAPPKIRNLLH